MRVRGANTLNNYNIDTQLWTSAGVHKLKWWRTNAKLQNVDNPERSHMAVLDSLRILPLEIYLSCKTHREFYPFLPSVWKAIVLKLLDRAVIHYCERDGKTGKFYTEACCQIWFLANLEGPHLDMLSLYRGSNIFSGNPEHLIIKQKITTI